MILSYVVHRASPLPVLCDAEVGGETMLATVQGLEVELCPLDVSNGTITLRFTGPAAQWATTKYPLDAVVSIDLGD